MLAGSLQSACRLDVVYHFAGGREMEKLRGDEFLAGNRMYSL
jgi:hypothetical protein